MTDKEKLMDLILDLDCNTNCTFCDGCGGRASSDAARDIAIHLLSNGVSFETDNNIGCKLIPVTEKLPEEDGSYLVYKVFGNHGWYEVHGFAKDGRKVNKYDFQKRWKNVWFNYDSEYGYITYDSVTHWMPLPEPPKEDV